MDNILILNRFARIAIKVVRNANDLVMINALNVEQIIFQMRYLTDAVCVMLIKDSSLMETNVKDVTRLAILATVKKKKVAKNVKQAFIDIEMDTAVCAKQLMGITSKLITVQSVEKDAYLVTLKDFVLNAKIIIILIILDNVKNA